MKTMTFMSLLFYITNLALPQTNFWRNTNGPYIGSILAVASDSSNYILGRDNDDVFRSSNGGSSWERVGLLPATSSIVIKGDLAFIGSRSSIFRSTDAGLGWTVVFFIATMEEYFSSFCITSEGHILAGIYGGGVLRSTNAGNNWSSSNSGLTSYSIRSLVSVDQNQVFAVSDGYAFLSTNGGINWTQQNSVPISQPFTSLAIDKQGLLLFAGSDGGGVYRSTNNGQAWSQVNNGLVNTYVRTVHATHSGSLYAGTAGGGLYASTNSGVQWLRCSTGLGSMNINSVSSDVLGNILAGSSDGFYRSTNGGISWKQANSGLANAYTLSIGFDPFDNVYAGTSFGLFQSSDHGESWLRNSLVGGFVNSVAFGANGLGFAAVGGGVYRTTDGGQTWFRTLVHIFNYSVIIHSSGFAFAGVDSGVFRSTDAGTTWARVGEPLINSFVIGLASSDQYIFAGSANGQVFRSGDRGDTWVQIPTGTLNGTVGNIAIHPNGHVFASTFDGGILRSTDNGNHWSYIAFQDTFTRVAVNADGALFVGTSYGVFRSSDEGATWTRINSGLTNLSFSSIGIDSRGYAFIGTNAGAVYASMQPTTSVDQTIDALPQQFVLFPNYPNPFNPTTRIEYTIPRTSHVSLKVFDVLGREVATLVNEKKNQGNYEVQFNGSSLSSGVLFYRLSAGGVVLTRKALLLK